MLVDAVAEKKSPILEFFLGATVSSPVVQFLNTTFGNGDGVGVIVGVTVGVGVTVLVGVIVGVTVAVGVTVLVGVIVGVGVIVAVILGVGVGVTVIVGVGVGVGFSAHVLQLVPKEFEYSTPSTTIPGSSGNIV